MLEEGCRLGHYRIVRPLSSGGMADVYEAQDDRLDRRVALKVLPPEFGRNPRLVTRFEREVRASAGLNHRNIVSVFEVGVDQGLHFYSMRLLTGGDLRSRIDRGMKPVEALQTLWELAHAFDHAHRNGFVHRDMKPENVIFDEQGVPVLTDFGIAKVLTRNTRATRAGVAIGTPHYISPEQARGHAVDARTDLYALGTVFFEMLTGKPPYDAEDALALIFKHATEPIPLLPDALSHLQPLVDRLMAKHVDDRIGSAAQLIAEINRLLPAEMAADRASSADPDVNATLNMRTSGLTTREEIERKRKEAAAQRAIDDENSHRAQMLEDAFRWQQRRHMGANERRGPLAEMQRGIEATMSRLARSVAVVRSRAADLGQRAREIAVDKFRRRDPRALTIAGGLVLMIALVPLVSLVSTKKPTPPEAATAAPAVVSAPEPAPAPSATTATEATAIAATEPAPIATPPPGEEKPKAEESRNRRSRDAEGSRSSRESRASRAASTDSARWSELLPRKLESTPPVERGRPPVESRPLVESPSTPPPAATSRYSNALAGSWMGDTVWTRNEAACALEVTERWHLTLRPDLSGKFRVDSYVNSAAGCASPEAHTAQWGGTISPSSGGNTFRLRFSGCVRGDCEAERSWEEYDRAPFDTEINHASGDSMIVRVRGQSLKLGRE